MHIKKAFSLFQHCSAEISFDSSPLTEKTKPVSSIVFYLIGPKAFNTDSTVIKDGC